jgi:hypothetical protein
MYANNHEAKDNSHELMKTVFKLEVQPQAVVTSSVFFFFHYGAGPLVGVVALL